MIDAKKKKKDVLKALEASLGVVTTACKKSNISRSLFYRWLKEDPEFAENVKDIEEIALDFAESQLFNQIKTDNVTATIFYLKHKGKKRGYTDSLDITTDGEKITNIKVDIVRSRNEENPS